MDKKEEVLSEVWDADVVVSMRLRFCFDDTISTNKAIERILNNDWDDIIDEELFDVQKVERIY